MDIDVRQHGPVNVVKMRGNLKLGEPVEGLRSAIEEIFSAGRARVVLNLGEVPMIDSSGIGVLVRTLTTAKQRGGTVKLVNPTRLAIQTLKLVGLLNLFEVYEEEKDAVESFT